MTQPQPQLTDQQRRALETREVSVALSAGAGCGKTFVLTRRFLDALDPVCGSARVSGIVAITFTDRAAREMRDRIRVGCAERLRNASAEHREHWQMIVREMDSARIGTIHAFCASLLRTYAVEAGVDPDFSVAEADVGRSLLRRTVTDCVHRLLTEHDDDCMEFVLEYGLERAVDTLITLTLGRFHGRTASADSLDGETRTSEWRELWRREFVPRLLAELQDSHAVAAVLELLSEHVSTNTEMLRRRTVLLNGLPALSEAGDPQELLEQCRAAAQVRGGGGKAAWSDDDVYERIKTSFTELRKRIDSTVEKLNVPDEDVRAAAGLSVIAERLLQPILEDFATRKRESGILDFDDLLLMARELLRSSESVRRRVAAGIDLLMVDEFQDTDPVQAAIVRDICGEGLLNGKLFLVGDVKQSIYRFRRADPRVFIGLRGDLPEEGRLPLSHNFRSQPAILNFVNALFAQSMGEEYEPLVPHVAQLSPTPAIEFLFPRQPPGDGPTEDAEDRRRREADWLASRVAALLRDDVSRVRERDPATGETRLRRARPGDVAILFRTLSNVAIYEDALRRQGIDYYLIGGRAFYAQQEIYDLMNLCSYLDDPDDEVALTGILRSPMFGLTDESLFAMADACGSFSAALDDHRPHMEDAQQNRCVAFAAAVLSELRGCKDRLPLVALLERFLDRTGYDAVLLTEFLGRRKLANLKKLIEMAREFDRSGLLTLAEFVQRLRESVLEQTDEELAALHAETGDVVRLMTVHQSKGLEYRVVIVADMDWHLHGGGATGPVYHSRLGPLFSLPRYRGRRRRNLGQLMHRLEESDEEERETARLLYVATTRAADHLILSAGLPQHGRATSPWLKLLSEHFNLQTGLPAVDPYLGTFAIGEIAPERIPDIRVHQNRPVVSSVSGRRDRQLPLAKFRDAVADAAEGPVPPLIAPVPRRLSGPVSLSVSEVVAADHELRATSEAAAVEVARDEDVDRRLLGTVIHRIIELLDDRDRTQAVMSAVFDEFQADVELRKSVVKRVTRFQESKECRSLLGAEVCHREVDFLLHKSVPESPETKLQIRGQIDALYCDGDGRWHLIDFKTGRQHADDPAALIDAYGLQLHLYAEAAAALVGSVPDEVVIVHVDEAVRRFALPADVDAGAACSARLESAVTAAVARFASGSEAG